ncbi:vacuolar protein sorting-associated protein 45 [Allomyces javanicus]|nr:vacuolar protein sorting-associated protein 45 [Allomyces javanicus]
MNVVQAAQGYMAKMVGEPAGMKVLLLDPDTTSTVSSVCTQSFLLAKEVYLVDRIGNKNRDKMAHLKCVCFCRPTQESIAHIIDELKAPKYGEYYLYFSNVLKKLQVEKLAEADEHELVREVQECFADYLAINSDLFTLDMDLPAWPLYAGTLADWDARALQRTVDGLASACLALKKRPVIRYAASSPHAKRLAHELGYLMQQEKPLFEARTMTPATVLIVDRRADPVTPLLNQWTYQAMVHEVLGIHHGLVDLSLVDGIRDDLKTVVLAAHDDQFYATNMYANFGDLGVAIKAYLAEYQRRTPNKAALESIADMKKFVDEYPEVRRLAGNVSKHVALTSELSRIVDAERLLDVSEVEQNVACADTSAPALLRSDEALAESVATKLRDPLVSGDSKFKLAVLFALHNPRSPHLASFKQLLADAAVSPMKLDLMDRVVRYATTAVPASTATGTSATTGFAQFGKTVMRGLKGVENVYTQHVPPLHGVLEALVRGKLKESAYPFLEGTGASNGFPEGVRVNDVIVFMVGGTTFEEARFVHQLSASVPGVRVVLGGNTVHNSQSFLKQIYDAFAQRVAS